MCHWKMWRELDPCCFASGLLEREVGAAGAERSISCCLSVWGETQRTYESFFVRAVSAGSTRCTPCDSIVLHVRLEV
jgi:hypothetical protein